MIERSKRRLPLRAIFAWPSAIFLLGIAGLVSALTGGGWRDSLSWMGLSAPVLALVWAMRARRN